MVASVVRNEASRYLPSALECWFDFADEVVVLDDGSTDGTVELCRSAGALVYERDPFAPRLWGGESEARRELHGHVMDRSPDWVFYLDADMCVSSDPRPHLEGARGLAFRLYDIWGLDPLVYRCDAPWWQAHTRHHPWAIRGDCLPSRLDVRYSGRGLHSGHLPVNYDLGGWAWRGLNERHCVMLHYGYADAGDRVRKEAAYLELGPMLEPRERAHALTITREPELAALPVEPDYVLRRACPSLPVEVEEATRA